MNMTFDKLGALLILAHNAQPPSKDEWAAYFAFAEDLGQKTWGADLSRGQVLIFTDGGAPNSAQRAQVNEYVAGRKLRQSIVTASTMVRGIVTALSWFNPETSAFAPQAWEPALAHLRLTSEQRAGLLPLLRSFQDRMGKVAALVPAIDGLARLDAARPGRQGAPKIP
jgi:hypothetical protein